MRRGMVPDKFMRACRHGAFGPGVQALLIKLGVAGNTGAGKLAVRRHRTRREAGGLFYALRFILYRATVSILAELTHISAAGRGFNITVCER